MPSNSTPPHPGQTVTNSAKNATAIAAQKAQLAARYEAKMWNQNCVKTFVAAMTGVIILFTAFHWSRFLYSRYASTRVRKSGPIKAHVAMARSARHVFTHRVPGFTSIGHALLVTVYLGINIAVTVTNINWSSLLGIANRLGWMAIANVAFITFLALKNTPLAILTAYSYERLNPLHQVGGYTTIIYSFLHALMQCVQWPTKMRRSKQLLMVEQIHGITAASALLIMLVFAILIRGMRYEVFYLSHIFMYIVFIVNIAYHQPNIADKVVIITIASGAIWSADRLLRAWRLFWYSYDNRAKLIPLPQGGTRIVLRRAPTRSVPGNHCFVWIPEIRAFETHPFTIVSKSLSSIELVIAAYDGFTDDLHNFAVKHPGASLRASFDGPYETVPDFSKSADKVIFISGGSGASFTFGVALEMVSKLDNNLPKPKIEFIWTVREPDILQWFSKELRELRASPRVNVILHSTRPNFDRIPPSRISPAMSPIISEDNFEIATHTQIGDEKHHVIHPATSYSPLSASSSRFDHFPHDLEKHTNSLTNLTREWDLTLHGVLPGRPDVETLINNLVSSASDDERIAIAACGPESLMWTVRRTATNAIKVNGPSIELHCEQFGW